MAAPLEVWEWVSNFIQHFIRRVITDYLFMLGLNQSILVYRIRGSKSSYSVLTINP